MSKINLSVILLSMTAVANSGCGALARTQQQGSAGAPLSVYTRLTQVPEGKRFAAFSPLGARYSKVAGGQRYLLGAVSLGSRDELWGIGLAVAILPKAAPGATGSTEEATTVIKVLPPFPSYHLPQPRLALGPLGGGNQEVVNLSMKDTIAFFCSPHRIRTISPN